MLFRSLIISIGVLAVPRTLGGAGAERIDQLLIERVPPSDAETQPILHLLAGNNLVGIVVMESQTLLRPLFTTDIRNLFNAEDEALAKVDYAFEFFQKLGVEYFCFHDRDIAPEGDTLRETDKNLDKVVDKIEENMKSTGIKLLWNTSSLFTNPRFVSGASTSPFADIYAYAGGQLKHSLEIAKRLGAENYTVMNTLSLHDALPIWLMRY